MSSDTTRLEELATQTATELLQALDFEFSLSCTPHDEGVCLMIESPQAKFIIGEEGERLDDLQYLLNRAVQGKWEDAPRVRVDCNKYRQNAEEKLLRRARSRAERVLQSGSPLRMEPLNAYQRRLVHNALAEMEGITTASEETDSRFKRITISPA